VLEAPVEVGEVPEDEPVDAEVEEACVEVVFVELGAIEEALDTAVLVEDVEGAEFEGQLPSGTCKV
jgi:hypothetical protein